MRALVLLLAASTLSSQSLDPKNPAPLKPGMNSSNIDAFMTPHYWTLIAEKGDVKINVTFRAQSILGAQLRTTIGFNIYDVRTPDKKFTKLLESSGEEVSQAIEGPSEAEHQMVIEVLPPKSVVRAGGDYQIQAVAGVKFVGATPAGGRTGSDPILSPLPDVRLQQRCAMRHPIPARRCNRAAERQAGHLAAVRPGA